MTPTKTNDIDMKGWSDADREAYQKALDEAELQEAQLETHRTAEAARKASAVYQIQLLRERAEVARVERETEERRLLGERELVAAQKKHGKDRVALLMTFLGPIIIRAATSKEADANDLRIEALPPSDHAKAWRDFTADLIVFPERVKALDILEQYPGTWADLRVLRDGLSTAARSETAKKG